VGTPSFRLPAVVEQVQMTRQSGWTKSESLNLMPEGRQCFAIKPLTAMVNTLKVIFSAFESSDANPQTSHRHLSSDGP
jgi:hypothetical protein